ncbi:MAG: hypothetical protein AAF907_13250, partial [Planctomycetota bacterium]
APEPAAGRFVQLLGEKGAGKTTTLLRWRSQQPGPYRHVGPTWRERLSPLPVAPLVYWDEIDRVFGPRLSAALRAAKRIDATVVAGTHRDLTAAAGRFGFDVSTVRFGPLDRETVRAWIGRRLAAARVGETCWEPGQDEVAAAIAAAGHSWRTLGDRLHVLAARAAREGTVVTRS